MAYGHGNGLLIRHLRGCRIESAVYITLELMRGILPILAAELLVVLALLSLAVVVLGWFWKFFPLGQRARELTFVIACALLLTPVPVGVGVGAMIYPLAVLYQDRAQLIWHLHWFLSTPWLLLPSAGVTMSVAYFVMHRLFRKRNAPAVQA
ncbi:MAG: hypothetical protein ACXWC6_17370 [Ramlibacter sp.]